MEIAELLDTIRWDLGNSPEAHLLIHPCVLWKEDYINPRIKEIKISSQESFEKLIKFLEPYEGFTVSTYQENYSGSNLDKCDIVFKMENKDILRDALKDFGQQNI